MVRVAPGQTITLLDYHGAGCVRRFWVTIAPRSDIAIHSQAILRMYWDGDEQPSVECPIGAFFGVGFGEQRDFVSQPLSETSGGYNCHWPMPFHKSAHWTLTNGSDRTIEAFYYNIDFTALDSLPPDTRHFHAQFRRENPTNPTRNYTILELAGEGHYVGTALFMAGKALYFLEGDEEVYVDGETEPSIRGTGTEDYFGSGWYYDRGTFSAPYHGLVLKEERRISTYRWHIEDPIPFRRSLRFTIEHGSNNTIEADYSSVAYFYLAGPAPKPPALPSDLLPSKPEPMRNFEIPGAVEAETLKESVRVSGGGTWIQDMGNWNYGEQWSKRFSLFWSPGTVGSELRLPVPAVPATACRLHAYLVCGPDFGIVSVSGAEDKPGETFDLYSPVMGVKELVLGPLVPKDGRLDLRFLQAGRNPASKGLLFAVDAVFVEAN